MEREEPGKERKSRQEGEGCIFFGFLCLLVLLSTVVPRAYMRITKIFPRGHHS